MNDKLGTGDIIESEDKAIELARTYLKDHGGIPGDIDDTRTHAIHFADFTAKDSHLYSVRFYRNASEYMIQGFSMRNMMIMKFDGSDGSLMYFEWHWPDFKRAYELTGITSIKETLKHYGMDSNSSDRHNITNISIMFYVPVPVQKSAYDVSAKIYYIAPYWAVSTDTNTYYLGMVTKDG